VTQGATLTINPQGATGPTLSAVSLSPASVVGGTSSTGTVTLSAAAPAGGALVSLSSNSGAASVPAAASVTVPAGATAASFTITTTSVTAATAATISAVFGGVTRTSTLTVNPPAAPPPPPGQTVTLTVRAKGRSGERVTSSPAGINVSVGSSRYGSFTTGTSFTLSVTNVRDAIWSGACSSGGNKAKSCTFTIGGDASVSVNVR